MTDKAQTLKAYHFDFGWRGSIFMFAFSMDEAKQFAVAEIKKLRTEGKESYSWFYSYGEGLLSCVLDHNPEVDTVDLVITEKPCIRGTYFFKEDH